LHGATLSNCTEIIRRLRLTTFCYWCDSILTVLIRTIDHVVPLTRGGKHEPENLVACCSNCNRSKKNKLFWEWDGELAS
jgi:5-methylcytosine-specific restriction protein A